MQALKVLVIAMAALIVAGVVTIAVTIANRASAPEDATEAAIALPAGARVLETALDGKRIALRLRLADGGETVHVYDLATGERRAALRLRRGGGGG